MTLKREKKRMALNIRNGDTLSRVISQHVTNQIAHASRTTAAFGKAKGPGGVFNTMKDAGRSGATKRKEASGHEIETDAESPHIDLGSLVGRFQPQFGSRVVERAQIVAQPSFSLDEGLGEAEVAQVDLAVVIQHVFQLEILVYES